MRAEEDLFRRQIAQLAQQLSAVLHCGVVWLIAAEEAPDGLQLFLRRGRIDPNVNGKLVIRAHLFRRVPSYQRTQREQGATRWMSSAHS
jgi:hypothetical protein